MKSAIVLTSIHDCTELLNGYLANFAKYGRQCQIYLIPDLKTVAQNFPSCIKAPIFADQDGFLRNIEFRTDDIPRNSDNRRNVGYLMALADGAEIIVSIDDDNYCQENEDFIGSNEAALLEHSHGISVSAEDGWVNNCNLLRPSNLAYPRGFPYYARKNRFKIHTSKPERFDVRINAGMWIEDPDLDAMTWLNCPFKALQSVGAIVLSSDTWCPINSQNTAIHRDLMAAYYFVRMIPPNDRFGDIFQGYFALKIAKHMGWTARFGSPVVIHRRNSHNYLNDVQAELPSITILEELLPKLMEYKLTGTTVGWAYLSLADFIEAQSSEFYFQTAKLMRQWAKVCDRIGM